MIVTCMALSPFDKRLLSDGLAFFDRPRLATLLEMLGPTRAERVAAITAMVRNSSPHELDEAVIVFERALERAGREQSRTDRSVEPDSRRRSASAERREQRRRGR